MVICYLWAGKVDSAIPAQKNRTASAMRFVLVQIEIRTVYEFIPNKSKLAAWQQNVIDDVDNTIGGLDVCLYYTGIIDKYLAETLAYLDSCVTFAF